MRVVSCLFSSVFTCSIEGFGGEVECKEGEVGCEVAW